MTHAGLAHLTGSNDHDRLFREVVGEDPFGQLHHHTADRCRSPSNPGTRANLLYHLESSLKNPVQHPTRELCAAGEFIGLLDLARDFGLAQHHRIQASSNSEQMARGLKVFIDISVRAQIERLWAE